MLKNPVVLPQGEEYNITKGTVKAKKLLWES